MEYYQDMDLFQLQSQCLFLYIFYLGLQQKAVGYRLHLMSDSILVMLKNILWYSPKCTIKKAYTNLLHYLNTHTFQELY